MLPIDVIVAKEVTRGTGGQLPGREDAGELYIVDLGKQSQDLMVDALSDAKTVFWNGPLGVFEIILRAWHRRGRTDACRSRRPGRDRGDRWR